MVPVLGVLALVLLPGVGVASPVDHSVWTRILLRYVDNDGFVDYQGLSRNRAEFDRYIAAIQESGPATDPDAYPDPDTQLAYYINAYNAMVFKGVLDRGPEEKSVWRGMISGLNFFVRMKIVVDGKTTNLKELEDDVVRARFKDPRIHAALNCASIGCPRLIRMAYEPEHLQQQLEGAATEFLNSSQHVRVEPEKKRVGLSKIFDWYEEDYIDFEEARGAEEFRDGEKLINYVNRFRSAENRIPLDYKIYILPYDKAINNQS